MDAKRFVQAVSDYNADAGMVGLLPMSFTAPDHLDAEGYTKLITDIERAVKVLQRVVKDMQDGEEPPARCSLSADYPTPHKTLLSPPRRSRPL